MKNLFSIFLLVFILSACNKDEITRNIVENNQQIELRSCPWCVYADIRGGLAGGAAGSFLGPIGGMLGAVAFGFADSYHEYYGLVDGNPDLDKLIQQLNNIESIEIEVIDTEYDAIGKLHNKLFVNALRKEFILNQSFTNEGELIDWVFRNLKKEELFSELSSEDFSSIEEMLRNYLEGSPVKLSTLENFYIDEITGSDFYKKEELEMKTYLSNIDPNYVNNQSIRGSISIAYYTHYFWNEILK